MSKKYIAKSIILEDLVLDQGNPRFAELYNGSSDESEIIEYLLYTESADEIVQAIVDSGEFYDDRPLWVYESNGKYIVKDGNRRCSAVKALQLPNKYGLGEVKFPIDKLPTLVYNSLDDLETRIRIEHNSSLFKKWGRIAKALEIFRLFSTGNSLDSLTDIDSNPKEFVKIASFYHEAVKLEGEAFKKLVREGRGKTGGKTIVFERLFRERNSCGYSFKHSGEIIIKNKVVFDSYIKAIVTYLTSYPNTTSRSVDQIYKDGGSFLSLLNSLGFPPTKPLTKSSSNSGASNSQPSQPSNTSSNTGTRSTPSTTNSPSSGSNSNTKGSGMSQTTSTSAPQNSGGNTKNQASSTNGGSSSRGSVKLKPVLKRKKLPSALKALIDECYNLDQNNFANAKTALVRVTFECCLKYCVENSNKPNGKPIKSANHFDLAFKNNRGIELKYTNFDTLKSKFTELIKDTGIRKAFENFDLQNPHQIIHNYRVSAVPANAKALCDNLIDLVEFMIQEESDLIAAIDMSKL